MGRSDVEELETRIRELEATVTGLTDELLECKQRIDELEDAVDAETDIMEGPLAPSSDQSSSAESSAASSAGSTSLLEEVDTYTAEGNESESEAETEEESDGIIVA